ncbi:hypothetical protein Lal_00016994 [Lupinus albus]|nr:hypothetical protein Lal_00016994 [Lupinus albus]
MQERQAQGLCYFQLYEQTLEGPPSPKTLRFKGFIATHVVTVLVDIGYYHNVLQPHLAQHLQLPITPTPKFPIMVENPDQIKKCARSPSTLKNP